MASPPGSSGDGSGRALEPTQKQVAEEEVLQDQERQAGMQEQRKMEAERSQRERKSLFVVLVEGGLKRRERVVKVPGRVGEDNITMQSVRETTLKSFPEELGESGFVLETMFVGTGELDYEIHTNEQLSELLRVSPGDVRLKASALIRGKSASKRLHDNMARLRLKAKELAGGVALPGTHQETPSLGSTQHLEQQRLEQQREQAAALAEERVIEEDLSMLGNLRELLPADRSRLTVSHLEDQLSAYRISWGSWKSVHGNKTIEDLFDELLHGVCDLYGDDHGVIRVVRLVRVKIRHPESGQILVNALKMVDGKRKQKDVHSLPAYKCNRNEAPYHAALRNIQQEIGYAMWGNVSGIDVPAKFGLRGSSSDFLFAPASDMSVTGRALGRSSISQPRGSKVQQSRRSVPLPHILDMVQPQGFDQPTHEYRESKSFPGLRTAYYINTLLVDMTSPKVPRSGSFPSVDQLRLDITRLWQWMSPEHVNSNILNEPAETSAPPKGGAEQPNGGSDGQRDLAMPALGREVGQEVSSFKIKTAEGDHGHNFSAKGDGNPHSPRAGGDGLPAGGTPNDPLAQGGLVESQIKRSAFSSLRSRFRQFMDHKTKQQKERNERVVQDSLSGHFALPDNTESITTTVLSNWLRTYGVDTSKWGTGQAKHVHQLVDEVKKGEADLVLTQRFEALKSGPGRNGFRRNQSAGAGAAGTAKASANNRSGRFPAIKQTRKVLRIIKVAKVELLHPTDQSLVLVETHQRLSDGRLRVRFKTLSEKFKPREQPWEAAVRGIEEELLEPELYTVDQDGRQVRFPCPSLSEMKHDVEILTMHSPVVEITPSPSYPGLETRYILHKFSCVMPHLPTEAFRTDEQDKTGGSVTHFWQWETRSNIKMMTDSLINQVNFYHTLVDPHKRDVGVMTDWLFQAAKGNEVDVIKVLCGDPMRPDDTDSEDQDAGEMDPDPGTGVATEGPGGSARVSSPGTVPALSLKALQLDPSQMHDKNRCTPLRVAALHNSKEAVDILIRIQLKNAQEAAKDDLKTPREDQLHELDYNIVNQTDNFGCTLIYYAAVANCVEVVKQLLSSKSVAVNSVCLHSCVSRGAVEVLPVLLSRLRFEDARHTSRILFGIEQDSSVDLSEPEMKSLYLMDSPRADNFAYFQSLLEHIDDELSLCAGKGKVISKLTGHRGLGSHRHLESTARSAGTEVGLASVEGFEVPIMAAPLRALEVVLGFCNPTAYYYKSFLRIFLHKVIELDDHHAESVIFRNFVNHSRFPLHIALISAHVLRSIVGLEKRFWDSYQFHADKFQDVVCSILDCCEDQAEAEELLRERADIPAWRREDGSLVTRPYAHRHKSTCSYVAVKYRLKKVVAHKFFTTQNDSIWFNDEHDSMYTSGLGRLNHVSASLFHYDDAAVTFGAGSASTGKGRHDVDRKTRNESLVSFVLRVPGLKTAIQSGYRLSVSIALLFLLVGVFPVLWVLPFSRRLRSLVDIPRTEYACCYYKWSVWSMSFAAYLTAFAALASSNASSIADHQENDGLANAEMVLFVFFAGNSVGLLEQVSAIGWGPFCQHPVNLVDTLSCFLVMIGFIARFVQGPHGPLFEVFMSLGALFSTFRLFHLFSASKELGPLWITMQYVVWDVIRFVALLAVVLAAFILAFIFLIGGRVQGFDTAGQAFSSLLWSVFEAFTGYDPNQSFQTQLYQLFLFSFLLVAAVLLTNLLIAMMTDRYNAVQQTARIEWLFALAQLIDKYSNMPILPPPFNLLVAAPNFYYRLRYGRHSLYDPDSFHRSDGVTLISPENAKLLQKHGNRNTTVVPIISEPDKGGVPDVANPVAKASGDAASQKELVRQNGDKEGNLQGKSMVAVDAFEHFGFDVNKEEMQALNFRSTRRGVVARFVYKCRVSDVQKRHMTDTLANLTANVERCRQLIMEQAARLDEKEETQKHLYH